MKINNINNTNFKAVIYTSNSKIYTSTYLTLKDKEMLKVASEKLKDTQFWDLEVTGAGLRIASRFNKDAFLDKFNLWGANKKKNTLTINSIYDGHADDCAKGVDHRFPLYYKTFEEACAAHKKYVNLSSVDRAIYITEKLEENTRDNKFSLDPEGTITEPKSLMEMIFDHAFKD